MTDNDKYSVKDLISSSLDHKPTDFANIFNSLVVNKLETAVANRKIEVAQNMFGDSSEEDTNTEEE